MHHLPPRRLTCRIIRCPPSTGQHRRRRHCCNPFLTPTALVVLSASHNPLLSRCLSAVAIVSKTLFLLQPLLLRLPSPALVTLPYRQRYGIAPVIVAVTPQCRSCETLMLKSTLASTAFASHRQPLAERHCNVLTHFAPNACCRCCCQRCHHLRVVVVIAATPTFAVLMPPGELSCHHLLMI